jgi:hypothetical protein
VLVLCSAVDLLVISTPAGVDTRRRIGAGRTGTFSLVAQPSCPRKKLSSNAGCASRPGTGDCRALLARATSALSGFSADAGFHWTAVVELVYWSGWGAAHRIDHCGKNSGRRSALKPAFRRTLPRVSPVYARSTAGCTPGGTAGNNRVEDIGRFQSRFDHGIKTLFHVRRRFPE